MPIPFSCECGKKLQAKDEFAGKKLKCPGCGKILTIPNPAAAPPPEEPPAPPPTQRAPLPPPELTAELPPPAPAAAPAAVVQFVCHCGRRLKARLADAGEAIDCPDCGRTLIVPASDTDVPPPVPAPKRAPVGDGLFSQTVTPWKDEATRRQGADDIDPRGEKVGSSLGVLVAALVLVGALTAMLIFGEQLRAWAINHEPKPAPAQAAAGEFDELQRVPADALTLLTFRPDAAEAPPPALGRLTVAGLPVREVLAVLGPVERVTVVSLRPDPLRNVSYEPAPGGKETWVLVRTPVPYDRLRLLTALDKRDAYVRPMTYVNQRYLLVSLPPPSPKAPLFPPAGPGGGFAPPLKGGGQPPKGFGPPGKGFGPAGKGGGQPFGKGKGKGPGKGAAKGKGKGRTPGAQADAFGPPGPEAFLAKRRIALYFAAPDVLVLTDAAAMRRFLAYGRTPSQNGPLAGALDLARGQRPLVVGLNQGVFFLKPRDGLATPPGVPPLLRAVAQFTVATGTMSTAGGVQDRLQLTFKTEQAAKEAADALTAWKADQEQKRRAARYELAARRSRGAVGAVALMLGSAVPGRLSPLGPLHLAPVPPELPPSPEELATLERLRDQEALHKALGPLEPQGNTLTLAVRLPQDAAPGVRRLAAQLWAPYAELAANADVGANRNPGKVPANVPQFNK